MILRSTHVLIAALLMGAAVGPAQAQMRRMPLPSIGLGTANPSAIVAAELGLSRLAREKGQWSALRELSDKDAVLFEPGAVNAQRSIKGRAEPAQPANWNPSQIFISCDGSYGMAVGAVQNSDGARKHYVAVWRQQRKGDYRWVMRFTADAPAPTGEAGNDPVPISATVATCRRSPNAQSASAALRERERRFPETVRIDNPPPATGAAQSADGTLRWTWNAQGDERTIEVFMQRAEGEERVFRLSAPMSAI